ncbi:MAG: MFS transporter [Chloroflexota bacterium]
MLSPIEALVRKHLRFNFVVGLLDGGAFGLGMGFSSFAAIIPLFVHHLTDSALLIGLVPAIHNMGWQLPQLFTAGWISRLRRYKPLTLALTVHERLPFLGLSLIALSLPGSSKPTILALTFLMLVWQGFGAGLAANPWTNLVSKVIPQEMHGTFFGAQSAAFNGFAGASAVAAGVILGNLESPLSFSVCFALTFLFMALSFVFLALTREPDSPVREAGRSEALLGRSLQILRRDANFRAFLGVRVLSQFAGMGFAFYVIYAVRRFGVSDAAAAVLVAFLLIGQVVLGPLMGRLGDLWSHRGIMSVGALGAALSAVLAWRAVSPAWFYAVFLLEAVAIVAIWTIPLALSVRFAQDQMERPLYIGLSNTLPAPAAILAPAIGGWIADAAGYDTMFILSAFAGLAMALALWFIVKDPNPGGTAEMIVSGAGADAAHAPPE